MQAIFLQYRLRIKKLMTLQKYFINRFYVMICFYYWEDNSNSEKFESMYSFFYVL